MIKFFVRRPILTIVIALLITIFGLLSFRYLPLEQYPKLAPPIVVVTAQFPGASAETMANCVAAPLEGALSGMDHLSYMFSKNTSPGNMHLYVFFKMGTDPNRALMDVQNGVNFALPSLPKEVVQKGVRISPSMPGAILFVALEDQSGLYDEMFLANYANIFIAKELNRIEGVSRVEVINGREYSVRIWLKSDNLAQFGLIPEDIIHAIQEQNSYHNIGEIGQEPSPRDTELTLPVTTQGRFSDLHQFENIVLRANPNGSSIFLKDVARIELGAKSYDIAGSLNGHQGAFIGIYQDSGANTIKVAKEIRHKLDQLKPYFPSGVQYTIPYDISYYVKHSLQEIVKVLVAAALLVSLMIFLFLHSFRASIIPIIAMVISILGTFFGMYLLDYSINTLTLFGIILAVGVVVDDEIVVIENIEHHMRHSNLSAKAATIKAMREVTGPVVGMVFALCAVFIPVSFIGGESGTFYKQFALTIVVSVIISGFLALTLTPVLAILLFKKIKHPSRFGAKFNLLFERLTQKYMRGLDWCMRNGRFVVVASGLILIATLLMFALLPIQFLPLEDQGVVVASAELPNGASLKRVKAVSEKIERLFKSIEGVKNVLAFSGFSLRDSMDRNNAGSYYISLNDWSKRSLSSREILKTFNEKASHISEANIFATHPPTIPGIGNIGGLELWIINSLNGKPEDLETVVNLVIEKASKHPEFLHFFPPPTAHGKELYVDIDKVKAKALGVSLQDIYVTLQTLLGSVYVNDFNQFGQDFQVIVQAEAVYRDTVADIGNTYVRSQNNQMIPLKSLVNTKYGAGPTLVSHYNGLNAAQITVVPNTTSKSMVQTLESIVEESLLPGMTFAWGGLAYHQKISGGISFLAFLGSIILLFMTLAALFERWALPLIVLCAIPFGLFGALLTLVFREQGIDIYFQIAIIALIGVSAKNAILIVEFAKRQRNKGIGINHAAKDAAQLRFRAIIMTSLTLILAMVPLLISSGGGAVSRHSVGASLIGGMIAATFLAIFFVPVFFKLIEKKR